MLVNVQLTPDGPITQLDESALVCSRGSVDDANEYTTWVEYRLRSDPQGRIVHRSVNVNLKKPMVFAEGEAGEIR
jgi:hypothetical protein